MGVRAVLSRAAWIAFVVLAAGDLVALMTSRSDAEHVLQPLTASALLLVFATSVRAWSRTTVPTAVALGLAWCGDTLPPYLAPGSGGRLATAIFFLLAMTAYAAALAPLWARSRDGLRVLLAVPYASVVIGLYIACRDGAGSLALPVGLYATALAVMAFLAAGVNALTWVGGTLLLLCSSVLGIAWFLPGAWVPNHELWVMASYFTGHGLLLAGILRAAPPRRSTSRSELGGATLLIVESPA